MQKASQRGAATGRATDPASRRECDGRTENGGRRSKPRRKTALCDLVDWGCHNTISAVWSCLAAHAAVLYADGIVRERLDGKLSGAFDCEAAGAHPLLAGMAPRLRVPHSRLNDLPEARLLENGYRMLTRSAAAGVDAFVKEQDGGSLFAYFQGHPEYDTDLLLREYRRDVGRFLRSEAGNYPEAPRNYFSSAAMFLADDFRARATSDGTAIWSAIFRCGRWPPQLKTPGTPAPSASTGTGSNI